jgi:hypothetical protein
VDGEGGEEKKEEVGAKATHLKDMMNKGMNKQ